MFEIEYSRYIDSKIKMYCFYKIEIREEACYPNLLSMHNIRRGSKPK